MDRAGLPEESPLEPLRDSVGVRQQLEEAMGMGGVVRGMRAILSERDGPIHLDGHRPQLHRNPEAGQDAHVLPVKVGDGLRSQRDGPDLSVTRLHDQAVIDEVELDLERA